MTRTRKRPAAMGPVLAVVVAIGCIGLIGFVLSLIVVILVGVPLLLAVVALRRGARKLNRIIGEELDHRDP